MFVFPSATGAKRTLSRETSGVSSLASHSGHNDPSPPTTTPVIIPPLLLKQLSSLASPSGKKKPAPPTATPVVVPPLGLTLTPNPLKQGRAQAVARSEDTEPLAKSQEADPLRAEVAGASGGADGSAHGTGSTTLSARSGDNVCVSVRRGGAAISVSSSSGGTARGMAAAADRLTNDELTPRVITI